jgi:hypothetical protein
VVDVEREPDGYPSPRGVGDRTGDEPGGGLLQVEVVESEVEGLPRGGDELPGVFGDLEGGLAPVGQRADLDRQA